MIEQQEKLNLCWKKTPPVILQTESAECGLAALLMVFNHYGIAIDLVHLRNQHAISSHGLNLVHINQIAQHYQFDTHPVSIEMEEVSQLRLPCILHWDLTHFVVLIKVSRNRYVIHDPALGRVVLSAKKFSEHFTGVALQLWPGTRFKKAEIPVEKIKIWHLFGNITGLKAALINVFCLSLLVELFTLLMPIGNQLIMDHVIPAQDSGLLTVICGAMLLMVVTQALITLLRSWLVLITGMQIQLQWRRGIFDHLLKLPLLWFEKRKLGDIQSRFGSLDAIRETFTTNAVQLILDVIMVAGATVMMVAYSPLLFLLVFSFSMIYIVMRILTFNYYRRIAEEQIIKTASQHSHFMETLYGIATIKSMNMHEQRAGRWFNLNISELNIGIKNAKFGLIYNAVYTLIGSLDNVLILWIGTHGVMGGELSLGMLLAFSYYRSEFSARTGNIINMLLELKMIGLHKERVSDILLTENEDIAVMSPQKTIANGITIHAENITFRYDDFTPAVFERLSIAIPAGKSLAIIGASGCGKTTLLKVLCGLIVPSHGHVTINGIELGKFGLKNYRENIACVLQDDKLLSGTIEENISAFSTRIDQQWLIECAKLASIHDDIMALPMQYSTYLSELGGSISGGQKQRLMIARALYRRPRILFMDESTSHLDAENEARINLAIAAMNITRVIVAHRQSTVDSADEVFDMCAFNTKV